MDGTDNHAQIMDRDLSNQATTQHLDVYRPQISVVSVVIPIITDHVQL